MKHAKKIEKYDWTTDELIEDIGNLDYDSLAEHFEKLSKKFQRDSINDIQLNHPQVAEKLKNISIRLKDILEQESRPLADLCRGYNERNER
jgi:uncharacterized phage infection (PIP) family protein YhgE